MKIVPYLTFNGDCSEAIELYKKAFKTDVIQVLKFSELPANPNFTVPEEFKERIVQCMLKFGTEYMRLSDCGPGYTPNTSDTEKISLAIEASVEEIQFAFATLAEEGHVGMPLEETFYSPCAGVVFDKFGVMWNLVGQK